MKHKLLVAVAAAALLFPAVTSFAMVEEADLVLGGVVVGESVSDALGIYGDPEKITVPALNYCDGILNYGKGFNISYDESKEDPADGTVVAVDTTAENGVATSKGIQVGSTADDVLAAYGEPDNISGGGSYQRYAYYTGSNPRKDSHLMIFLKDNVVQHITVGYATGE